MSIPSVTTSKRLVHNTVFNVITLISGAAIGFFLIRFCLVHLGEAKYGLWVLIGSIFQYRRLLDMGMNSSINRYIPVGLAKDDQDAIQRILSTSFFFFFGSGDCGRCSQSDNLSAYRHVVHHSK